MAEVWLHAAEMQAVCRSGKATRDKGTVYLAKNSKRHSGKKHALPNELQGLGLESFIAGKLRVNADSDDFCVKYPDILIYAAA